MRPAGSIFESVSEVTLSTVMSSVMLPSLSFVTVFLFLMFLFSLLTRAAIGVINDFPNVSVLSVFLAPNFFRRVEGATKFRFIFC